MFGEIAIMDHRFLSVTFHSGEVRFFSAAEIQVQTCTDAREAIADISDNFWSFKTQP